VLFPAEATPATGSADAAGAVSAAGADGAAEAAGAAEAVRAAVEGPDRLPYQASAGADDRPEALLPLFPPGPRKEPWAGLPAATGIVELRGWIGGQPLAVAWIDGRRYWPQGAWEDIDPAGLQDLGTRFGM
jgi:hypothetical protein